MSIPVIHPQRHGGEPVYCSPEQLDQWLAHGWQRADQAAEPDLSDLVLLDDMGLTLARKVHAAFGVTNRHALVFHLRSPVGFAKAVAIKGVSERMVSAWISEIEGSLAGLDLPPEDVDETP